MIPIIITTTLRAFPTKALCSDLNPPPTLLRATSHTRLRARDRYTSSTLIGEKMWSRSKFASRLRDQWSIYIGECKMDGRFYMDFYLHGIAWYMVTWTILENHLLEVGSTQNRATMALQTFTTIGLSYFLMHEDMHEWEFVAIAFGWGPGHVYFTLHLRIQDHTTWFWGCVRMAFGHFLLGSHNFMVTALGSCVKWRLHQFCSMCHVTLLIACCMFPFYVR